MLCWSTVQIYHPNLKIHLCTLVSTYVHLNGTDKYRYVHFAYAYSIPNYRYLRPEKVANTNL